MTEPVETNDAGVPCRPDNTINIARGVLRLLDAHGRAAITELPLANGRRADVVALSTAGGIWIIEVKSCLADFLADTKWPDYWEFADQLYFAVAPDFPIDMLPVTTGLILADRYGGEIVRASPEARLPAARRNAMTLRFARRAAQRLLRVADPELGLERGPEA